MSCRPEVARSIALGPMPRDSEPFDEVRVRSYVDALDALPPPALTDEESIALLDVFPPNDSDVYEVAWSVLLAIESAPSWPIRCVLEDRSPRVVFLRERADRARC